MRVDLKKLAKTSTFAVAFCAASLSFAQSGSSGVVLKANLTHAQMGATAGNDCWGYVSPSGREYAIMGCTTKIVFVEVTNPSAPVILASIPHTSSTWGDIKVFGSTAYAVTESATGVQVVDMSQIDSGIVTLVTTLGSPARTHNLSLDTVNGRLYTCGSRNGQGTTECFDLSNPLAPTKLGSATITTEYQHDGTMHTYTSGPLAGKTYWFGFSEGRGVDVYDITNANAPVLKKRMTYPNMSYCHQGWLSEDLKYLYVDDELDEGNLNVPTRSLIFNVEDPNNGFFVGTFSSFLAAIDHNQYVDDGFTFQANYRSGLQIFDLASTPEAPQRCGWYDTYPSSDARGFDGAWSNYPFFPSGTVIVSDINGGLFILDASEALTRTKSGVDLNVTAGNITGGGLPETTASDNSYLSLRQGSAGSIVQAVFGVNTFDNKPDKLAIEVESKAAYATGFTEVVQLFNWGTGVWETIGGRNLTNADTTNTYSVGGDITRFVNQSTKRIEMRLGFTPTSKSEPRIEVTVDKVAFKITR